MPHILPLGFSLPGASTGKGAPKRCGARGRTERSPGILQFASLAVSTGVRPQRVPRGPGYQADARNWSCQEPHVLLTWARTVTHRWPTPLPGAPHPWLWGAWGPQDHLNSTSPFGEGVPSLARPDRRPRPWLLLWSPSPVRVMALWPWEPGQGRGVIAVAASLCQHQEII